MSVQISYKKQTIFGIFLIIIILFAIEGLAHVYELFYPHCIFPKKDAFDKTSFFLTSQMCLDHNKVISYIDTIHLYEPDQHYPTININSHGFRGSEITLEKPVNTYRIFLVGGSTTFGVASSSDETTVPGFLQKEFDKLQINSKIEVINAGIGGADSAKESYYIKKILKKFNPDMYIINDGYNDAVHELEYSEYGEGRVDLLYSAKGKKSTFKFSNYPEYRTPFVVYDILFYKPDPWNVDRYVNPNDVLEKIELWKNRWSEVCKINKNENTKTIITIHPTLGGSAKKLSHDEALMLSKSEYHNTVIKTIDLMADTLHTLDGTCDKTIDLRYSLDNVNEPVYFDLAHVNDLGNKIIAEKIFDEIYPIVLEDLE